MTLRLGRQIFADLDERFGIFFFFFFFFFFFKKKKKKKKNSAGPKRASAGRLDSGPSVSVRCGMIRFNSCQSATLQDVRKTEPPSIGPGVERAHGGA